LLQAGQHGSFSCESKTKPQNMLRHLNIKNFAIIEALELEFNQGFTAITGETGAGKSILVDALSLLTGARADKDWVRSGANRAELSAEFSCLDTPGIIEWLSGQELDDGDGCLVRRTLSADGGSRAYINGNPVALGQLQTLGARLLEIHGQHGHQALLQAGEQLRLLDAWGGNEIALSAVESLFDEWAGIRQKLDDLSELPAADQQFLELLQYQIDELHQHALPPEAFVELEQDHRRLSHAGELLAALNSALEAIEGEEVNAGSLLAAARQEIDPLTGLDSGLKDASEMLQVAMVNVDEARASLSQSRDRVGLDPAKIEELERKLGQLHDLARKHRVEPDKLEDHAAYLEEKLLQLTQADVMRAALEQDLKTAETEYREAAVTLSGQRQKSAARLGEDVSGVLGTLAMDQAGFTVMIGLDKSGTPRRSGLDHCEFMLSSNPGQAAKPLKKIASGGELSRISLAIKAVTTAGHSVNTQIFDEVDAGIGGDTANAVGALLALLAPAGQALCVTHLAQVAACANHQLNVSKQAEADATSVMVNKLAPDERVGEIARMLSGEQSEESLAHARQLLK